MTPDPLSQLRDIHLPMPGGVWPPAPGWWLLAAVLLVIIWVLVVRLRRHYRRNRWLKAAKAELNRLHEAQVFDTAWFGELNGLLKRCARTRYPERQPHSLSGRAWGEFLLQTGGHTPPLCTAVIDAMVAASWQATPECDPQQALAQARLWLRRQRC
ncbi:DUF4381 domain-containing protein [Marinobacter sp. X15-166B]|uniref:DUF4381 domain-containing protein n=1 Tax=Marinobacter sp. X15-166B TaxID=1897620 RepID=UPI001D1743CD|nr:DUF4381 domain-containing protein [Marinobacter sp. X15-166B]